MYFKPIGKVLKLPRNLKSVPVKRMPLVETGCLLATSSIDDFRTPITSCFGQKLSELNNIPFHGLVGSSSKGASSQQTAAKMPIYESVMQEKPPIVLDIGTAYTK